MTDQAGEPGDWPSAVTDFWFSLDPNQWWRASAELDHEVRDRFQTLYHRLHQLPPKAFLTDAGTALAAVILFDQFPRNMFRGHADQYRTDTLALAVAKGAVERGFDEALSAERRGFLYMPFQHSEQFADQQRSLMLFTALGDDHQLEFAKKHHSIIARFGRFPHRNAMLGRAPRPGELAAGDVLPW